jgi:predicted nucleotidyltransferase
VPERVSAVKAQVCRLWTERCGPAFHRDPPIGGTAWASEMRVFGFVARGEACEESDVDFLVDLELGRSLLDPAALVIDLQEIVAREKDPQDQAVITVQRDLQRPQS